MHMPTSSTQIRLPMYFRILQAILENIQSGRIKPGEPLPSEADLGQQYRVSRITAKRALDELVHQGRAFRQQGRGTFVAQARIREISGFRSFSEDIRARGFVPGSKILKFEQVEAEAAVREHLHLLEDEHVFLLKRLRLASDEPVAVETAYVPCRLCPGLLQEDLARGSLYQILMEKYQVVPTWADAEIEAIRAGREETSLLKLNSGQPLLAARRVTYSANYDAIETVYSVYRGDRFTFYTGRQYIG